jgi:hypothetical protein
MKLPELKYGQAGQLTLKSPQVAAAGVQAIGNAVAGLGRQVDEYQAEQTRKKAAVESVSAQASANDRLVDTLKVFSHPFMPVDSAALDGYEYDAGEIKTDADGKQYIPTSLVSEELIEKQLNTIYEEELGKLTTDDAKQAFEVAFIQMAGKTRLAARAQSEKNSTLNDLAQYQETYNSNLARLDFDKAAETLQSAYMSGAMPKDEYEKQRYNLTLTKERTELLEVQQSEDPEAMRKAAEALESEDYKGALLYPTRVEIADQLDATADKLESERLNAAVNAEVKAYSSLLLTPNEDMTQADVQIIESTAKELRSDDYDGAIEDPVKRRQLAEQLEAKASTSLLSASAQAEQDKAREVSDLQMGINSPNGGTTVFDVEAAFAKGTITGPQRTAMTEQIATKNERMMQGSALNYQIDLYAANGTAPDPKSAEIKQAISARFEQRVAGGENPIEVGMDIMRTNKIMPEQIKGMFRGANRADAGGLAEAGAIYSAGLRLAPGSMQDLTGNSVELVSRVAANIDSGMTKEQAVQTVLAYEAMNPTDKQARADQMTAYLSQDNNINVLAGLIDQAAQFDVPWTTAEVTPTIRMQSKFDFLVRQYLPVGGSIEEAQRRAFQNIRADYQLTNVNGEYQYMQYAPQGNPEAIKRSIEKKYGPGVIIQSDTLTELQVQNGEAPTYKVYRDEPVDLPWSGGTAAENGVYPPNTWQGAFQMNTGLNPDAIGIQSRDEAEVYVTTVFSNGPVELDRFTWNADEELQNENQRIVNEAKTSFSKRADFDARQLDSKVLREVTKGIPIKERDKFISSDKGREKARRTINNLMVSGDIDKGQARGATRRLGIGQGTTVPDDVKPQQAGL